MKPGIILFILFSTWCSNAVLADVVFGRLYTSPKQREQLDEARKKMIQGEAIIDVPVADIETTRSDTDEPVISQSISLNGIVYRTDGKNTAWINENSTNEGNLETQFTKVKERDVRSTDVQITLPDNQTRIDLKVGQHYDINTKEIHDLGQTAEPTNGTGRPANAE